MDYSPELLKKVQDKSLELMVDLDKFLRQNGIDYRISYGTELGAVRHHGFIPWDDDVDFDIHIDDMRKLSKIFKDDKEFNKKYFLQNKWTDPNVPEDFWRIRMNGTTMMDKEGLTIPMHWGLPVDIFPVYNAPSNLFLRRMMNKLYNKLRRHSRFSFLNPDASRAKKGTEMALYKIYYYLLLWINWCSKNSGVVYLATGHIPVKERFVNRDVFFPSAEIVFENYKFKCHHNPDSFLRITYGDYMTLPPKEKRVTHMCYKVDMDNDYREYVEY